MQITLPHEVIYDFDGVATVDEVAHSLLANERLIRDAVSIFVGCFPGLEASEIRVKFVSVAQESPLKEILAAAIFLAFQDDLEKEVPDLIQKLTGIDVPEQYDSVVTVFVMIAAIYGASYLYDRFSKKGHPKALPEEYDRLINVAGDYVHVSPDAIKESVEKHLGRGRRRVVARAARDFFIPAQRHKARAIRSGRGIDIRKEAIDEIPSDIDIAAFEAETDSYLLEDTVVVFQAHDLSRYKTGWAAIVPEVSNARKTLHIDPSINTEGLFTKRRIKADVIVFAEADEAGEYQPKIYYLQAVHGEAGNSDDDSP